MSMAIATGLCGRTELHPDAALLEQLRAGDEAAFGALVRRESGKLLAVARRILRSEEEAQDAVQDALLSAFQNLDRFEGGSRLSTWLHRITVNAALMRLRSKKRRREDSIEELLPGFAEDGHHLAPVSAPRDAALDEIASAQVAAIVRAAIDELPESYRVVLVLRDVEGLDTAETADALGIGPDAAKMRLHRARQALRTLLEQRLPKEAR
ncbi:MAG: sigma-70 family RNA polymerase sigma factor [Myxococcota bacterium]